MLLKISEFMQPSNNLSKQWKGVVKDNADPLQLGRVKCLILGLISEDADIESLPWIARQNPPGLGGSADSGEFAVPEIDTEVMIVFPTKDIYFPMYVGYWQHSLTHQVDFNEDYPNTYGWRDSTGNLWMVNKAKKFAEFTHASGSGVRFESDGGITVRTSQKIRFESADAQTDFEFDMNEGVTNSNPKGETEQGGTSHAVTAKNYREEVGSKTQSIIGAKDTTIDGSEKKQVGSDKALNVAGNKSEIIGGDKSSIIAGQTDVTYGLGLSETYALGDIVRNLVAGNYTVNVIAGNIELQTAAGSISLGNLIGSLSVDVTGNATLKGLITTLEALSIAIVKGPIVQLGNNPIGPVLTQITSPLVDNITGVPSVGVPTVLA